ncbi:hypothetical protein KI387_015982 [Taxus chinensis]|uniref:Fe2OG dioxygenase domain-containing protein n=1 Tax=Taxus chinensis TaxID=29808 RepID=A0AA38GGZ3_TAXCH|nr:hypothetical protein KI387_015982 [Taxus chinensis]
MSSATNTGGDECGQSVPVIDFSLLNDRVDDHNSTEKAYIKLRKACEEWGCFHVVNHGIKEDIIHDMDSAVRDVLFSKESVQKNILPKKELSYITSMPAMPYYKGLGILGADDPGEVQKFSDLLWPEGNPQMCKVIQSYTSGVTELTKNIIKAIMRSLGVSSYNYHTSGFRGILRINYYDIPANEIGGMITHVDYNCITVMYEDDMGGLQVKNKEGMWVDVKPVPNSFIVILGDCFKAWSNGRTRNVTHRVIMEGSDSGKCRMALPYFYGFPLEGVVDAIPELVDDEHPRLYKPFTAGEYREFAMEWKKINIQKKEGFRAETGGEENLDMFAGILVSSINSH